MKNFAALLLALVLAAACSAQGSPEQRPSGVAAVDHGRYLVNLLGCGRCHTEGYLAGDSANGPELAGSTVGIAYTASRPGVQPGLAFAGNLTPDTDTGLGAWSQADIVRAMTSGVGRDGHQRLPVMPWPNYGALTEADLAAIATYLQSLAPVRREIPETTREGEPSDRPYVRFGIYRFEPGRRAQSRDLP